MTYNNNRPKTSPINNRLFNSQVDIITFKGKIQDALFQHSLLCQTFLPYRNLGEEKSIWKQQQGQVCLAIQCNQIYNPIVNDYEKVGLPFGTKARLLLIHINTIAVRTQSPFVHLDTSISGFLRQLQINVNGKNIAAVKLQFQRLMVSTLSLGYQNEQGGGQRNLNITRTFEEAHSTNYQPLNWTSNIRLSDDYFSSLLKHAVPLDPRAIHALSHNAMAIDIYSWLVQRLQRIDKRRPQFIPWAALKRQFGRDYKRMCDFKRNFRKYLTMVKMQYPNARIQEEQNKGFFLHYSPSPIDK